MSDTATEAPEATEPQNRVLTKGKLARQLTHERTLPQLSPEIEAKTVPEPVVVEPVVPEPVEPEPIAAAEPEPEPLPAAGTSLAERLSEQPLDSLKNSLSINNRVRFASLLTDGDVPALLRLCDALEASHSFEAAQVLILEAAGDVDWDDEENGGVEFLSLVRRLFVTA